MKFSFASVFAGAAALVALSGGALQAQTTYYNAQTLPANPQTGIVNYMQLLNPAQGAGNYTLSSFTIGVNFTTGTTADYGLILDIWTGVNASPTAANALATATNIAEVAGAFGNPTSSGNFTYTFTLTTPISLAIPAGGIGVQFQLTTADNTLYSTDMNGRFSTVAPTAGTAQSFVWADTSGDGVFAGSEQTRFGQTGAYVRYSMIGTAPAAVPEPRTYALCGLAFAGLAGMVLRRRARA